MNDENRPAYHLQHGCLGCLAASGDGERCSWGYRRDAAGDDDGRPQEPCPRPLTADTFERGDGKREMCDCGKLADWLYMPGGMAACDACVPRGCSCNLELKDNVEPILDEHGHPANPASDYEQACDSDGRAMPCCEWWRLDGL